MAFFSPLRVGRHMKTVKSEKKLREKDLKIWDIESSIIPKTRKDE
jgi:hypothetical protein